MKTLNRILCLVLMGIFFSGCVIAVPRRERVYYGYHYNPWHTRPVVIYH